MTIQDPTLQKDFVEQSRLITRNRLKYTAIIVNVFFIAYILLNIKDIKSIYESLAKLVEGEIISDYQCDGCNRKVDLSKRTLISETPNVLIVHLQRIGFNFDTFENDKVNTLLKFPTLLDLKPYSYFEVMGKEKRLVEQ